MIRAATVLLGQPVLLTCLQTTKTAGYLSMSPQEHVPGALVNEGCAYHEDTTCPPDGAAEQLPTLALYSLARSLDTFVHGVFCCAHSATCAQPHTEIQALSSCACMREMAWMVHLYPIPIHSYLHGFVGVKRWPSPSCAATDVSASPLFTRPHSTELSNI